MGAACREAYIPATSSVRRLPRWRRPRLSTTLPRTYLIHSVTIHLKYRDGLLLKFASLRARMRRLAEVRCALPGLASGPAFAVRPAEMAPGLEGGSLRSFPYQGTWLPVSRPVGELTVSAEGNGIAWCRGSFP
jgi:hypothetical protein